jgi:diguanylate cyclase (GGDEF)-like protein
LGARLRLPGRRGRSGAARSRSCTRTTAPASGTAFAALLRGGTPDPRSGGAARCAGWRPTGPSGGSRCGRARPATPAGRPAGARGTLADVTAERDRVERLAALAEQDPLTGLANRARFTERLSAAVARANEGAHAAVLFVDVDGLKNVNDAHGHAAGDHLLRHVAERLLHATRGIDTVARLGGDEFGILVDGMARDDDDVVDAVARRILDGFAAPVTLARRHAVRASVSLGAARVEPGADAATVLRRADLALYAAKAAGRGGSRRSRRRCTPRRATAGVCWPTSSGHSSAASSTSSTSPWCHSPPAAPPARPPAWRRSSGGATPSAGPCRPPSSSLRPRRRG